MKSRNQFWICSLSLKSLWERKALEDGGEDYIVIKAADLEAGNERHLAKGSLAERIWGDMAKENLAKNPVPQRVMPDNDVEKLFNRSVCLVLAISLIYLRNCRKHKEQAAGQKRNELNVNGIGCAAIGFVGFMMGTYGAIARLVNSFAKIVDILSNIRIHQVRQMDPRDVPWPEREN